MMNSASAAPSRRSVISRVKLAAGSKVQSLPSSSSLRQRQRLAAGGLGQRALAEEAGARILVADEFGAGAGLDGEERRLAAIGARRAQEPVAGEDGVERAHEHRLDMHAGEIEVARVSVRLVAGDFAEAREPQPPRPPGSVGRAGSASSAPRRSASGAISIRASIPFTRMDDREAIEPRSPRCGTRRRGARARSRSTRAPRRPRSHRRNGRAPAADRAAGERGRCRRRRAPRP